LEWKNETAKKWKSRRAAGYPVLPSRVRKHLAKGASILPMTRGAQVDENKRDGCGLMEWKKQRMRKESETEKVSLTVDWGACGG
jgi:hypothetical protein